MCIIRKSFTIDILNGEFNIMNLKYLDYEVQLPEQRYSRA